MALLTLEDQLAPALIGEDRPLSAPELLVALHWPPFRSNGCRLPEGTADGPVLVPIVNHGRWLVRCPYCPAANRASRTDLRFFCCECGNADAAGRWLPVAWPPDAAGIEAALAGRPRHLRNWFPGETVRDLARENASPVTEGP